MYIRLLQIYVEVKMIELVLDKRYNSTRNYLKTKQGEPVFKKGALEHINTVLGPELNWRFKTPEEYYSEDRLEEAKQAMQILSFTGEESFKIVRKRYLRLSQGSTANNIPGFHPDTGGHPRAFDILNHAYTIFKNAE